MSLIGYALKMAKEYYDPVTYDHALRVATYLADNEMIPDSIEDNCIALGIMHDLLGDTCYGMRGEEVADPHFRKCLEIIAEPIDADDAEYIKNIKENARMYPEAYWVKIADIKDHLAQTNTLTNKRKNKYLKVLAGLL
ncbi:MAG: hypothetical protein HDR26_02500 [Lachnospiraceae bacterium]|nr:hypothetical protein [Lachnospiraceae bacterium]